MCILGAPCPVAPYRYLLPTMYVFVADIANPDLFVCIRLDIIYFLKLSSVNHPVYPHGRIAKETVNQDPISEVGVSA